MVFFSKLGSPLKFQVNRDVLNDAVAFVARFLPQRPTNPAFGGILIEADANAVRLSVFDHRVSGQVEIIAKVENSGRILISGRLLSDLVSKLPNQPVEFSLTGSTFQLVCGNTKVGFPTMDVNQFPTLPEIPSVSGTISAESFGTAVQQASVASLRDELEPIFASIQLETSGSELSLLATDKYRMALVELSWNPSSKESDATVMVPTKTLLEVAKTFGNSGDIAISIMNNDDRQMIAFQAQNKSVTAGLIKGGFPPIKTMFSADINSYAIVSKQDLLESARRAMLVVERDHHMRFMFNADSIIIETNPGELNQASERVDAELVGDPRAMELKPQFVIDGLSGIHTEFAKIGLTNMHDNPAKASPLLLAPHTGKEEAADRFRYLLQPRLLSN